MKTMSLALLLTFSVVAIAQQADRKYVDPKRPDEQGLPFSGGVQQGNTLYVGGNLGIDPKTRKPPAAPEDEARLAMDHVKHVVESAGMTMDDLVSMQVFCSDLDTYDAFNRVYRTYFHATLPVRAFLGVSKLLYGARFEVMGIAVQQKK